MYLKVLIPFPSYNHFSETKQEYCSMNGASFVLAIGLVGIKFIKKKLRYTVFISIYLLTLPTYMRKGRTRIVFRRIIVSNLLKVKMSQVPE